MIPSAVHVSFKVDDDVIVRLLEQGYRVVVSSRFLDIHPDDDVEGCARCNRPAAHVEDSYCLKCLCSYRRYFGGWPFMTPETSSLFGVPARPTRPAA